MILDTVRLGALYIRNIFDKDSTQLYFFRAISHEIKII